MPIVAIGASAGGLDALQKFLGSMPVDSGVAFVVVTHVSPDRESMLPVLLSAVTRMRVGESHDGLRLEPDSVVVARDSLLDIAGGVLRHVDKDDRQQARLHPIDHFFRSLATDRKEHAICVVLSGSGNDGTLGLKAVKSAGGMVMVQDPNSAAYTGMPDSALATGLADYVLAPEKLPAALVDYCSGPFLKLAGRAEVPTLPEDTIHAILVRLRAHSGQDFTSYKKSTISRRVERRMNVHRIDKPGEYLRYLRENPHEMDLLLQELLISVTSFFRDREAWDALASKAIPELLASRNEDATIRVWVPGCATGEEAYSVVILLHELIRLTERLHEIQVFATDLDAQAIDTARSGLYPEGIAADVGPERLARYFTKEDSSYRVHKGIRDMIVFAEQNVISDPPFTRLDLIVCRNLLIYLNVSAQQRVLPAFHYSLRSGGLLFLGSSETLGEAGPLFETIDSKHKIYSRATRPGGSHPLLAMAARPHRTPAAAGQESEPEHIGQHLSRSIERLLLDRFAPCSIVIDDRDTVIYLHGRSGLYLEPEQGQPRNNILEMAREGLRTALMMILREARERKDEAVLRNARVRTNGTTIAVDLTARPLTVPPSLRGLLLLTIRMAGEEREATVETGEKTPAPIERPLELERELQYTRESLQTTIEELETSNEELKSSNEELQSTNEELHSANEELETSGEEMQSLNEELNTVNAELQAKVNALGRTNDDMHNLLNSMQVATIFLDNELRVKRYTERARDVVRLIESDIGRPLADLTSSLEYDELIADCRRVLATLASREVEVQDAQGRWHLVRLMPYRTADNVIDGLVITIVDINRSKQAELQAQASSQLFEGIVQTVREPLAVLDADLRVVQANDAFYNTFATQTKQTEGVLVYELGNRQWNIPELRTLLEKVLPERAMLTDFRVEHEFPRIGRCAFLLNARRLSRGAGMPDLILLAFEDVTGRS